MRSFITPGMLAEMRKPTTACVRIASFHLRYTIVRFCTAPRTIKVFGAKWTGMGRFAEASEIEETVELRMAGMRYRLSGIPLDSEDGTDLVEYVRNHAGSGGRVEDWLLFWDKATWSMIDRPRELYRGSLDSPQITITGTTFSISLGAEGILGRLNNASNLRLNDESHQARHPGDMFFQFVSRTQRKPDDLT